MTWDAARAEVAAAMRRRGWNQRDLSREAAVDPSTLSDFLAGKRRVQAATQSKLERALDLSPGRLYDLIQAPAQRADEPEPYVSHAGPTLRDVSTDDLVAELARRARAANPEAR